jgi:Rrf2 family protein
MFNKETEYALRSLVYIKLENQKSRRPGSLEIAREVEAPHFFVAKILQRLVRSGLLRSIKGKNGGFYFDEKDPDLSLNTLISATEGSPSVSECGFGLKKCDVNNQCPMHERYAPIRDAINKLISEETVSSLAEKVSRNEFVFNKYESS